MERIMNKVGQAVRDVYRKIGVSQEVPIFVHGQHVDGGMGQKKPLRIEVRCPLEEETQCCLLVSVPSFSRN